MNKYKYFSYIRLSVIYCICVLIIVSCTEGGNVQNQSTKTQEKLIHSVLNKNKNINSPQQQYAYVVNAIDNDISMYSINQSNGQLTPLANPNISTGRLPTTVTVDSSVKYAYAVNQRDNTISMYSINQSNGQLIPLSTPTVSTGNNPIGIIVGRSGKYAYVANSEDNTISMYNIDHFTGQLSPLSTENISTGSKPFGIVVTSVGSIAKNH